MNIDDLIERLSNTYNLKPDDGRLTEIRMLCMTELTDLFDYTQLFDTITQNHTRCPVRGHVYQEIKELRSDMRLGRGKEGEAKRKTGSICEACSGTGGRTETKTVHGIEYDYCDLCTVCHGRGIDLDGGQNVAASGEETTIDFPELLKGMGLA